MAYHNNHKHYKPEDLTNEFCKEHLQSEIYPKPIHP